MKRLIVLQFIVLESRTITLLFLLLADFKILFENIEVRQSSAPSTATLKRPSTTRIRCLIVHYNTYTASPTTALHMPSSSFISLLLIVTLHLTQSVITKGIIEENPFEHLNLEIDQPKSNTTQSIHLSVYTYSFLSSLESLRTAATTSVAHTCPVYRARDDVFNFELLSKCIKTKTGNYNFAVSSMHGSPEESLASCETQVEDCPTATTVSLYNQAICFKSQDGAINFTIESLNESGALLIKCGENCGSTFEYRSLSAKTGALMLCLPTTESVCAKQIIPFCAKDNTVDFSNN
jgi:hypothetical protein